MQGAPAEQAVGDQPQQGRADETRPGRAAGTEQHGTGDEDDHQARGDEQPERLASERRQRLVADQHRTEQEAGTHQGGEQRQAELKRDEKAERGQAGDDAPGNRLAGREFLLQVGERLGLRGDGLRLRGRDEGGGGHGRGLLLRQTRERRARRGIPNGRASANRSHTPNMPPNQSFFSAWSGLQCLHPRESAQGVGKCVPLLRQSCEVGSEDGRGEDVPL